MRANTNLFEYMFQEEGEHIVAYDLIEEGYFWGASNKAFYRRPTPSRRSKRTSGGIDVGNRAPYERILSIDERPSGGKVSIVVRFFPFDGGVVITGTGNKLTPFTSIVREYIEDLTVGRTKRIYADHLVMFARRKMEPDHRLVWVIESHDIVGTDPNFEFWSEETLAQLNSEETDS